MENGPIELHFELTPRDVVHGLRVYDSRNALGLRRSIMAALWGLVAGACFWYGMGEWTWFIIMPLCMLIGIRIGLRIARPRQVRAMFATKPDMAGPYDFTFDDGGMHGRTSTIDSRCAWGAYSSSIEGPQEFLLLRGPMDYTLVPKRVFRDEDGLTTFRRLLDTKLGQAAR